MVKILAFPGRKAAGAAPAHSGGDPLTDSDSLISVTADGVSFSPRDWDNQELAGLYRVEGLLVQANISITTGRGVSDEGDPWFVFCREDGDVFVHLARIDGAYLLDSPGLSEVLHGADFAELISRFVRQTADRSAATSNVVALRPRALHDQTIRLHPAVMLAALVWSLYAASDDFVGAAHAMEYLAGNDDTPAGLAASLMAGPDMPAPDIALLQLSARIGETAQDRAHDEATAPGDKAQQGATQADARGAVAAATPLPAQAVAASLALIAVGYGFYAVPDSIAPEAGTTPADTSVSREIAVAVSSDREGPDIATLLPPESQSGGQDTPQDIKPLSVVKAPDAALPPDQPRDALPAAPADAARAPLDSVMSTPPQAAKVDAKAAVAAGPASDAAPDASDASAGSETQIVLKLVSQYVGMISDYRIGDLIVSTTLDHSGLDRVLTHIAADTPDPDITATAPVVAVSTDQLAVAAQKPAPTAGTPHYDDEARDFVSQFIRNAEKIEMVQFNFEIVLVDMSAIDEPTDIAYTRSWVTDDGHMISTIGHLQDFIDYGIA